MQVVDIYYQYIDVPPAMQVGHLLQREVRLPEHVGLLFKLSYLHQAFYAYIL